VSVLEKKNPDSKLPLVWPKTGKGEVGVRVLMKKAFINVNL